MIKVHVDKIIIMRGKAKPSKAKRLTISIINSSITTTGEHAMADFTKAGQFVDFTLGAVDSKDRPVPIPGPVTVTNSNEIAAGVFYDDSTRSGKLTAMDDGSGTVTFSDGEGVANATIDFTVTGVATAVALTVTVGPIQEPTP